MLAVKITEFQHPLAVRVVRVANGVSSNQFDAEDLTRANEAIRHVGESLQREVALLKEEVVQGRQPRSTWLRKKIELGVIFTCWGCSLAEELWAATAALAGVEFLLLARSDLHVHEVLVLKQA